MTTHTRSAAPRFGGIDLDNFTVDLTALPYGFWRSLGEAKSKCEHLTKAPLLPDTWKNLAQVYMIRGVHATTAIEGNTLSEDEVMAIFKKQLTLPPSRAYLGIEVENVIEALNTAWKLPLRGDLTVDEICAMNAQVLANLEVEEHVTPGRFRFGNVGVGRYRCPAPVAVAAYMDRFVAWYNGFPKVAPQVDEVSLSIIKAIAAHVYFVLIHPFGDGNGRTARLLEWRTMDHAQIASVATHLLSNHYNLTRSRYYTMLDRASMGGDLDAFLQYAVEGFVDQLALQLEHVQRQYAELVYIDIARSRTPGNGREVVDRRRELALAINHAPDPVKKPAMMTLTAALARMYANVTAKTLSRDLSALESASLIMLTPDGWVAVTDAMYYRHRRG